jgi:hypothetical protein
MCVAFACYYALPSLAELRESERIHDDGAGIAWTTKEGIRWEKGLALEGKDGRKGLLDWIEDLKLRTKEGRSCFPLLIHFRAASVGAANAALTHPFPLDGKASLDLSGVCKDGVLMHNGTFTSWRQEAIEVARAAKGALKMPNSHWSDTRFLAFLAGNFGLGYLTCIGDIKRVVVLNMDGTAYWGDWITDKGFIASNTSYRIVEAASKKEPVGFLPGPKAPTSPQVKVISSSTQGTSGPQTAGTEEGMMSEVEIANLVSHMNNRLQLSGVRVQS